MIAFLIILLIIAIVIINKLSGKIYDDKVIISNYQYKDKIRNLEDTIIYLESQEKILIENGKIEEARNRSEEIKSFKKKISQLHEYIYNNEQNLKKRG